MDSQFEDIDIVPNATTKYYYDQSSSCSKWTFFMKLIMMSKSREHQKILNRIKNILSIDPQQVNMKNKHDWTPLMLACRWLNIYVSHKCIKILIDAGANVNDKCANGKTSLVLLLQSRAPAEYFIHLLQSGADCNLHDNRGDTLLHHCADKIKSDKYYLEIGNILIKYGADTNRQNFFGQTPLMCISCIKHTQLVENFLHMLLLNNADVNKRDENGNTALMLSCCERNDESDFIEIIGKHGLDVNLANYDGDAALHIVCRRQSSLAKIDTLIKLNADINIPNKISGNTPLMCAALGNNTGHVKKLLSIGANTEVRDNNNETVLFKVVSSYNNLLTHILIDSNANVNIFSRDKIPMLHYIFIKWAEHRGKLSIPEQNRFSKMSDIIDIVLRTDIDANIIYNNETVLMKICKKDNLENISRYVIIDLIKISDLSIVDNDGFTAYEHCINQNSIVSKRFEGMLKPVGNIKSARKI